MADQEVKMSKAELKEAIDKAKIEERTRIKDLLQKRAKSLTSGFSPTDIAAVKALTDFASYL